MPVSLRDRLAAAIRAEASRLTADWAQRLPPRLREDVAPYPNPHDPQIVLGIATCLAGPELPMPCGTDLFRRARQWGEVAESRGVPAEDLVDAFGELGAQLLRLLDEQVARGDGAPDPTALVDCADRLFEAMTVVMRAVTSAYAELYQARIEADAERLRGFNRLASHELRGSISAIDGAASLLADEQVTADSEQRAHFVGIIRRSAARATDLLDNIVALTTLERASRPEADKAVAIDAAFRRVAEPLMGEAEQHGVRVEAEPPLPDVAVDRPALDFVLTNLLVNGIRYSDPAKPDRYVHLRAHAAQGDEPNHLIEVEDNGIGIPADARDHIFEQFYRAGPALRVPGTGLGLAIVKEAVERWGGSVWLESEEGAGTTFYFTAPAADDSSSR